MKTKVMWYVLPLVASALNGCSEINATPADLALIRFDGVSDVLGKTVRLGEPHEIVGVLPPDFVALSQPGETEPVSVWVPMHPSPDVRSGTPAVPNAFAGCATGQEAGIAGLSPAVVSEYLQIAEKILYRLVADTGLFLGQHRLKRA